MAIILQSVINGLISGAILMLPTVGFTLIYATLGFPNAAVAGMVVLGAYIGYAASAYFGLPMALCTIVAGLAIVPVGIAMGRTVFHQFHGRKLLAPLIAGVGAFMILENVVRFVWGNKIRSLNIPLERPWKFAGLHLNPEKLTIVAIAAVLLLGVLVCLKFTPIGRAIRAVADDPVLAEVRGINSGKAILVVWCLASALAGAAGVLIAADTIITPLMAWEILLPMFAAAMLGGIGSPVGAVIGAMVMGVTSDIAVMFLPPTYKSAVAFLVMVTILLFRPYGLFRVKL
jgi:branched-chain amino acid transport system permease protein